MDCMSFLAAIFIKIQNPRAVAFYSEHPIFFHKMKKIFDFWVFDDFPGKYLQ